MEYVLQELSYDEEKHLADSMNLIRIETHAVLGPQDEFYYSLERQDYVAVMVIAETVNNLQIIISLDTHDARSVIETIKKDMRRDNINEYELWKQVILYMMSDVYASFKVK